jgi:tRNA threonylcarbamoyladenosine biosynthesis protein TsaE
VAGTISAVSNSLHLPTLAATEELAKHLASVLKPGDVLCLRGDLGAGKTTFTRALVAALGSPVPVSSPTFTLLHEYGGGRLPVYHADAYRLRSSGEAEDIGLWDYLERGDGVMILEWPERIEEALPADHLEISLEPGTEEEERLVTLTPYGPRWQSENLPC